MTKLSDALKPLDRWVRCKGCGGVLGFFPEGKRYGGYWIGPGGCAHEKPKEAIGKPTSVPCELFRRHSAEELAAMHADSEEIGPPDEDLRPAVN